MKRKFWLWVLYRSVLSQLKKGKNKYHIKGIILKEDTVAYLNGKLHKHGYFVSVRAKVPEVPEYIIAEISSFQH